MIINKLVHEININTSTINHLTKINETNLELKSVLKNMDYRTSSLTLKIELILLKNL